jgi:hypothetical protein
MRQGKFFHDDSHATRRNRGNPSTIALCARSRGGKFFHHDQEKPLPGTKLTRSSRINAIKRLVSGTATHQAHYGGKGGILSTIVRLKMPGVGVNASTIDAAGSVCYKKETKSVTNRYNCGAKWGFRGIWGGSGRAQGKSFHHRGEILPRRAGRTFHDPRFSSTIGREILPQ